jgi:hypothetical protein
MRNLFALCIPLIAACGGGKDPGPVVIQPDQAVTPDQPTAAACPACGPDSPCQVNGAQQTSMGGLILVKDLGPDGMPGTADDVALGPNACGSSGTDPCDFFEVPTAGANMNKKTFFLLAGTPAELNTGEAGSELLLGLEVVGINGVFTPGTSTFTTNPAAITSALIFAQQSGTQAYDSMMYIVSVSGQTINSVYMSTSGSITTTEFSDQPNGKITGEVAATNFSETDGMTTGGCTTSLDGLTFKLIQGQAAFQNTSNDAPYTGPGGMSRARALEIYKNMKAYLKH